MEKWRCRGKCTVKSENDGYYQYPESTMSLEKKKSRKWSLGGLLKRNKTKHADVAVNSNENNHHYHSNELHNSQISIGKTSDEVLNKVPYRAAIKMQYEKPTLNNLPMSINESQDTYSTAALQSRNSESSLNIFGHSSSRRTRIKARLKAKRKQYSGHSSSDDENKSNNLQTRGVSEDFNNTVITTTPTSNTTKYDVNRRTRGARTERYMKRLLYRDDGEIKKSQYTVDQAPLINCGKKYSSDTLSPHLWTTNDDDDDLHVQSYRKSPTPVYYQSYCSQQNIVNIHPSENIIYHPTDLHDNDRGYRGDKHTWPQPTRATKIMPINECNKFYGKSANKIQPPTPPPRSSKSRLFTGNLRFSLQHSDIENYTENLPQYNVNCHSLDRRYTTKNYNNSRYNQLSDIDCNTPEEPIVPNIKNIPSIKSPCIAAENYDLQRKCQSKNLEEALQELETIYNSLRLSDEDLMDRAEQRSMDEYRDKVATTVGGSIKSSSDTSSSSLSYEMSRELGWRHASFDRSCHEARLKDDMAYRRMHQNDRPTSVDPSLQNSLSQISYLTASPCLFNNREIDYCNERPKSRRQTPDLTRDDVAFRSIYHANNTLKVVEPQPPFGIPLGPVTTAAESDYLHVEPTKVQSSSRSLFIPQNEPDIINDDLAFRNLRKDSKDKIDVKNNLFLPKIQLTTGDFKKKRAVRSLSADLYGIIDKNDSQHTWYKEYVKLNRPLRSDDDDSMTNDENSTWWFSNREYDLDINGNRPKRSTYKGRVQVCVPEDERIIETKTSIRDTRRALSSSPVTYTEIKPFTDHELSEYKQLCRDLESLINKTSEKVQNVDGKNDEMRKDSLDEFVEWEELLKSDVQSENTVESPKSMEISGKEDKEEFNKDNEEEKDLVNVNSLTFIEVDGKPEETNVCTELNSTNHDEVPGKINTTNEFIHHNNDDNETTNINSEKIHVQMKEEIPVKIDSHHQAENSYSTLTIEKSPDDDASAAVKSYSTALMTLDNSAMFEGEKTGNKRVGIVSNDIAVQQILNVCFTNCLSAYSVALWSLFLTLLIAIIVAR